MDLSIVIPLYASSDHIRRCLDGLEVAIRRAGDGLGLTTEVICVDDASGDDGPRLAERHALSPAILSLPENLGFAGAANTGLREARGEWVALLNQDTEPHPDWIVAALSPDWPGQVAALASSLVEMDRPDILESAGNGYTRAGVATLLGMGRRLELDREPGRVFSACAAAAFYRRSALDQVGLLDQSLGAYLEDVELGFRLNLAGLETWHVPGSLCRHAGSATYGRHSWRATFLTSRNIEQVFFTCMPRRLLRQSLAAHLLTGLLHLFKYRSGFGLAYVAGKVAALARAGHMRRRRAQVQEGSVADGQAMAGVLSPARRHPGFLKPLSRPRREAASKAASEEAQKAGPTGQDATD